MRLYKHDSIFPEIQALNFKQAYFSDLNEKAKLDPWLLADPKNASFN